MKVYFEETLLNEKNIIDILKEFPKLVQANNAYDAEIIFSMPKALTNEYLDKFKNLKMIQLYTAGYDTLDLNYLRMRNITLLNAKDVYSIAISEDVVNKILLFNKNTFTYFKQMESKIWEPIKVTHELYGSTVGIIGAGSIGIEVAKRLKPFNTKILGYKRTKIESPYFDYIYTDSLDEIYEKSDYIIISIASNKQTKALINRSSFHKMKKAPLIINVARGDIIVESDLIEALKKGFIRGAALDVTNIEPLPESSELWTLDNVFITPHSSNMSPNLKLRLIEVLRITLKNIFNNEALENIVINK